MTVGRILDTADKVANVEGVHFKVVATRDESGVDELDDERKLYSDP